MNSQSMFNGSFVVNGICCVFLFFGFGCHLNGGGSDSVEIWGFRGGLPGRFSTPRAIAWHEGWVYVIDKTGRVQKFQEDGTFALQWTLEKIDNGTPTGITIDENGELWIPDTHNSRILHFDGEGRLLSEFGEFGREEGFFVYPTDLALGERGELFITEYGARERVQIFTRSGEFVKSWGEFGDKEGQLNRPMGIVRGKDGLLYIADTANHRIQVFKESGELVNILGKEGKERGEFEFPYDIDIDEKGRIYVCEFGNGRIQCLSTDGECLAVWGKTGSDVGELNTPWGVAVGNGKIFVADAKNHRIQIFASFD